MSPQGRSSARPSRPAPPRAPGRARRAGARQHPPSYLPAGCPRPDLRGARGLASWRGRSPALRGRCRVGRRARAGGGARGRAGLRVSRPRVVLRRGRPRRPGYGRSSRSRGRRAGRPRRARRRGPRCRRASPPPAPPPEAGPAPPPPLAPALRPRPTTRRRSLRGRPRSGGGGGLPRRARRGRGCLRPRR